MRKIYLQDLTFMIKNKKHFPIFLSCISFLNRLVCFLKYMATSWSTEMTMYELQLLWNNIILLLASCSSVRLKEKVEAQTIFRQNRFCCCCSIEVMGVFATSKHLMMWRWSEHGWNADMWPTQRLMLLLKERIDTDLFEQKTSPFCFRYLFFCLNYTLLKEKLFVCELISYWPWKLYSYMLIKSQRLLYVMSLNECHAFIPNTKIYAFQWNKNSGE